MGILKKRVFFDQQEAGVQNHRHAKGTKYRERRETQECCGSKEQLWQSQGCGTREESRGIISREATTKVVVESRTLVF